MIEELEQYFISVYGGEGYGQSPAEMIAQHIVRPLIAAMLWASDQGVPRSQGIRRLRLETGIRQPEAIVMYERMCYYRIPRFGDYADELSVHMEKKLV